MIAFGAIALVHLPLVQMPMVQLCKKVSYFFWYTLAFGAVTTSTMKGLCIHIICAARPYCSGVHGVDYCLSC